MERETVCLTESAGKGDLVNMSKVQMHEEELSLSKEENESLLDAVLQPQLRIHRADVQQLVVVKEEFLPDQQEWSTSVDQKDPEPPPHIKQEQEELRISQEGQQLQELEEADITKSTFTPDPVKSEDDEEKPQSSQPHQRQTEHMETEADGDDCRGPEPARNSDPESSLQPKTEDDTGDSSEPDTGDSSEPDTGDSSEPDTGDYSEPDTEDSADWKDTRKPASGSNSLKNRHESVSDPRHSAEKKPFSCSVCKIAFSESRSLKRHMRIHKEKRHSCSVCKKQFSQSGSLNRHMRMHTGEKPHCCSVCKKAFSQRVHLKLHMRIHTAEKPVSCSVCKKAFSLSGNLKRHMRVHTAEKPFSCSVCKKAFSESGNLKEHMRVHTGEEIYSCNVCDKRFKWRNCINKHKCVGRQSSKLNEIQTEDNREAEPPISSSAEHKEADGEDNEYVL